MAATIAAADLGHPDDLRARVGKEPETLKGSLRSVSWTPRILEPIDGVPHLELVKHFLKKLEDCQEEL